MGPGIEIFFHRNGRLFTFIIGYFVTLFSMQSLLGEGFFFHLALVFYIHCVLLFLSFMVMAVIQLTSNKLK